MGMNIGIVMEDINKNIDKAKKRLMVASDLLSLVNGYQEDVKFLDDIIEALSLEIDKLLMDDSLEEDAGLINERIKALHKIIIHEAIFGK